MFMVSLFSKIALAGIGDIKLTEQQLSDINSIKIYGINKDSIEGLRLQKKQSLSSLESVSDSNYLKVLHIVKPLNGEVYLQYPNEYLVAEKIATHLVQNQAEEFVNIQAVISKNKDACVVNNIKTYLQNRFFDFFYNNNVLDYLKNPEYVALVNDRAAYKLLLSQQTEQSFIEDLQFIGINSKSCFTK